MAAPNSGSGKTTITLGLLRHLRRQGTAVSSAKVGPDYIDPNFHAASTGRPCRNLCPWGMRPELLHQVLAETAVGADFVLVEGVMGLFDGAADASGSTADVAALAGLPVVLVVDAAKQSQSVAATVHGFATLRRDVRLSGVILNRVKSPRHERLLRQALSDSGVPVLGAIPESSDLVFPERHLGLVQAGEHNELEEALERAAAIVGECVDIAAFWDAAGRVAGADRTACAALPPLGQRIAVASDVAFSFFYPHLAESWRRAGAEILPFSPLADEAPDAAADAVFLPGGYPELHAGRLAGNRKFISGLRQCADHRTLIYGECGGYMILGQGLIDAAGERHQAAGLLPLETSFAVRRLHLGYRQVEADSSSPWPGSLRAHEFHYATVEREERGQALFQVRDAEGNGLPPAGLIDGRVMGSFVHLIDRCT